MYNMVKSFLKLTVHSRYDNFWTKNDNRYDKLKNIDINMQTPSIDTKKCKYLFPLYQLRVVYTAHY